MVFHFMKISTKHRSSEYDLRMANEDVFVIFYLLLQKTYSQQKQIF